MWLGKTLVLMSWLALTAMAIPEIEYDSDYREQVSPLFSLGTSGELEGRGGVKLRYRFFPRSEGLGTVLVVPGYSESLLKYPETIHDLWSLGYSVYIMDHRGMGLSGRELANTQIVHVRQFEDYVADLEKFFDEVVSKDSLGPKFMLAHSAGGLIAAHLMARRQGAFNAAALSAPAFALNTGKYPHPVAWGLASGAVAVGKGEQYALGYGDFDLNTYLFETNRQTHSRPRFESHRRTYERVPAIQMGGPSFLWVKVWLEETAPSRIKALAKQVETPTLILQAEHDSFVLPRGQSLFCRSAKRCDFKRLPGSFHELLRETDPIRTQALDSLKTFFQSHLP